MTIAATLDLRELALPHPSDEFERSRLRERRIRRIADDVRTRVYPVDADRVAASILRRLAV